MPLPYSLRSCFTIIIPSNYTQKRRSRKTSSYFQVWYLIRVRNTETGLNLYGRKDSNMLPSHLDRKALAMIDWDNALHFFLIPFFWEEECLGRRGAKWKKFKVIFSSVETASGQLVPVPGGCQGSLAFSWRHVLAFLTWWCYLHIVKTPWILKGNIVIKFGLV